MVLIRLFSGFDCCCFGRYFWAARYPFFRCGDSSDGYLKPVDLAVGLFMLKTWGRWMAMICSPLLAFISLGILGILWGAIFPPDVVSMIIKLGPILLSAVIVFYLFRPKVKEQFK